MYIGGRCEMNKRELHNGRRKKRKMRAIVIATIMACVLITAGAVIGVYALGNDNKDLRTDGTSIKDVENDNNNNLDNEADNVIDGENDDIESINTAINRELTYTTYDNDIFADNAKEIEVMLSKWNYLREDGKKIAYLTFDDGPSLKVTPQILSILKANDVKATFFVLGSNVEKGEAEKELLKEMVKDGHAIGNHGYCHNYSILYPGRVADPTAFLNDMDRSEAVMKSVLGDEFNTKVIRFPGGHMSWKTSDLDQLLEEHGYSYIDWNALNGDAEANNRSAEQLMTRLKGSVTELGGNDDVLVVLMHDTDAKETTAQALQGTIDYLRSLGYEFRTLK